MPFVIQTNRAIFTEWEIDVLERYGTQFMRLMNGERAPETAEQTRFVKACRREVTPETEYERVWCKYLARVEWESDPENRAIMDDPDCSLLPCPKCGRECWGKLEGPADDRHVHYQCPDCHEHWREPTRAERRRIRDLQFVRRDHSNDPNGTTSGIPNSDGYP